MSDQDTPTNEFTDMAEAFREVVALLQSADYATRTTAATFLRCLGEKPTGRARRILLDLADSGDELIRRGAFLGLSALRPAFDKGEHQSILEALSDKDWTVRLCAAGAAGLIVLEEDPTPVSAILKAVGSRLDAGDRSSSVLLFNELIALISQDGKVKCDLISDELDCEDPQTCRGAGWASYRAIALGLDEHLSTQTGLKAGYPDLFCKLWEHLDGTSREGFLKHLREFASVVKHGSLRAAAKAKASDDLNSTEGIHKGPSYHVKALASLLQTTLFTPMTTGRRSLILTPEGAALAEWLAHHLDYLG